MTSKPGIRNFQTVTDWLYRGGQPNEEQLKELAQMGIKTIICLRSGRLAARAEKAVAEGLGMQFVHVPLSYWKLPDEQITRELLEILDDEDKRPVFVHCFHGADRTGFVVAVFRMARQGWSVQQAYNEMKKCGFHRFRLRHFKWVLWDYAKHMPAASWNKHSNVQVKRSGG